MGQISCSSGLATIPPSHLRFDESENQRLVEIKNGEVDFLSLLHDNLHFKARCQKRRPPRQLSTRGSTALRLPVARLLLLPPRSNAQEI
jgi:hypothetical protein